jgi:hypothetical protein
MIGNAHRPKLSRPSPQQGTHRRFDIGERAIKDRAQRIVDTTKTAQRGRCDGARKAAIGASQVVEGFRGFKRRFEISAFIHHAEDQVGRSQARLHASGGASAPARCAGLAGAAAGFPVFRAFWTPAAAVVRAEGH